MASFRKALDLGADAVECDVHLSRDGRLVVLHDESLDRTTNGTGPVKDLPWSRIRRLDAGRWFGERFRGEHPPALEKLLIWARRKPLRVVVEVKTDKVRYPGIEEAVARAVRAASMEDRTLIISFHHPTMAKIKSLDGRLFTGLLFDRPLPDLPERLKRTKADAIFPRVSLVTERLARWARARGLFVGTWTVNETADLKRMVRLGVDAVATNYPERLAALR